MTEKRVLPLGACRTLGAGMMCALAAACDAPPRTSADFAATLPATSATPVTKAGEHPLASFPADSAGRSRLTLSLAPCATTACPLLVRLVEGSRTLDSTRLDWPGVVAQPVVDSASSTMGIGDPAAPDTLVTWTTGEEEAAVSTTARSVALTGTRPALLVAQAAGFEHVKHRHYLLAADSGHIIRLWSAQETAAPGWTVVDASNAEGGTGLRLLLWHFTAGADVSAIAEWRVEAFSWNSATRTLDATHGTVPVFAVVLHAAGTTGAATLLRSGDKCVEGFALVRRAGSPPNGRTMAIRLTGRKSVADSVAATVARCASRLAPRVETWESSDIR